MTECAILYTFFKNLKMLDPKFVTQFLEEEKLPDNYKTPPRFDAITITIIIIIIIKHQYFCENYLDYNYTVFIIE